jgi:hypothetical protein
VLKPLRSLALWMGSGFSYRVYADAMHALETGQAAAPVAVGAALFDHLADNPELAQTFHDAMTAVSTASIHAVLAAYDFGGFRLLVDVGGGHGSVIAAILKKHPRLRGVLFDLDTVVAAARNTFALHGVDERCSVRSGDFFAAVPAGADGYLLKHIVHDLDDSCAGLLLRNIHAAMADDGRLILIEAPLPEGNEPSPGKLLDLEMLVMLGGRERTLSELRALLASAGFEVTRVLPTRSPFTVIEARGR